MSAETHTRLTDKQQYWLEHIKQAKLKRQPLKDYAGEYDLDLKALYNYHWLLRKKGLLDTAAPGSDFIQVTPQVNMVSDPQCAIVFPNGIRVVVTVSDGHWFHMLQQVAAL